MKKRKKKESDGLENNPPLNPPFRDGLKKNIIKIY